MEEGIERTIATVVEINIYATKVVEYEVADRVGALDRIGVGVEGFEKPVVFLFDEISGFLVGPKLLILLAWRHSVFAEGGETDNIFIVMV